MKGDPNSPLPVSVREIRKHLKLTQQEFWEALGVTQSGGSRYECGREPSKPVRQLIRIRHQKTIDTLTGKSRKKKPRR